jgi:Fe-S-cluster containining protein
VSDRRKYLHAQLDAFYASLPDVACKGLCGTAPDPEDKACGAVVVNDTEYELIETHVGRQKLKELSARPQTQEQHLCPLLGADGRCSIYGIRPFICRAWGAYDDGGQRMLTCNFGCEPSGGRRSWLEFLVRLHTIESIGGRMQRLIGKLHPATRRKYHAALEQNAEAQVDRGGVLRRVLRAK